MFNFGNFLTDTDIYTLNVNSIYGINNETVHEIYNFKQFNSTQIDDMISNNPDKNIYFMASLGPDKLDHYNMTQKGTLHKYPLYLIEH